MIALAARYGWVVGFLDEVWWSRFSQPALHTWAGRQPLRLREQTHRRADPERKALACYGLLRADSGQMWLRFVDGRPVSALTIAFLEWVCARLAAEGQRVLVLVWDNASWHISRPVREWIGTHNATVKQTHQGVRIVVAGLPTKSPWLNRIEPKWLHGKRAVVEPDGTLTATELEQRICGYYHTAQEPHLIQPQPEEPKNKQVA